MAAGAGNPQLKLQVSLDLAFLRNQLATISTQLGGQALQINAKLNRNSINKELNLISAQFRRRTYRIDINDTSIKTARVNAQKLKNTLDLLASTKYAVNVEYRQKGAPGTFAQSPLGAAGLEEYMRSQGLSGGGGFVGVGREERLKKALNDLTVNQLKNLAKSEGITGFSRLSKDPLIDKLTKELSQTAAENLLGNIKNQMRDIGRSPIKRSFLDQIARAVLYMAGVDPAAIRAQQAARLAPPTINWPSVRPGMQPSNIPPSMALPPGRAYEALPGTAYGAQKLLLGDLLTTGLKTALRDAANAFVDNVRNSLNAAVRSVSVRDLGTTIRGFLTAAPSQLMLPPAGGTGGYFTAGRRPGGGYVPPGGFPSDGMMGPTGGGRGGGGGNFRNLMGFGPSPEPINFQLFQQARLPLSGAIAELASEFSNATKQVLLFGTAYKALAFFLDLPNQAFQAAKSLATYENQLKAITATTGTFEQSFAFVDNLAQRFNVPLQSARDGFVKLYASMQPAGFNQGEIENLFTGISKATAAFGLSADKVDRVNYAFAQMASKGQIMSEELKGQLGDVLPGSLALFAEAAQMSIPEFSKAMEDGAFKGKAMQQVLDNVAILMNTKFGPAAEGASKTLQGSLNQIQNNLKLMYEGLAPIVNQFAAAFGPQVNSLIKDVTSAFQALTGNFLEGTDVISTLTPRAAALYQFFQQFGPSVVNAANNIGQFISSLQVLVGPLLAVTKGILDFVSLPVVARVALYATTLGVLNGAFQLLTKTGIISATVAFIRFALTLNVAQLQAYAAGIGTIVQVLIGMINTANAARLAIMALKLSLVTLGVGVVLIALDVIAQKLLNIQGAAEQGAKSIAQFRQELNKLAELGLTEEAGKAYLDANTEAAKAKARQERALRASLRATAFAEKDPTDLAASATAALAQKELDDANKAWLDARQKLIVARKARDLAFQQQQRTEAQQPALQKIDLSAGDAQGKAQSKLQKYYSDQTKLLQGQLQEKLNLLKLDQESGKISEYDYQVEKARLELIHEQKIIQEGLRVAIAEVNNDNLSAQNKALKITDLQKQAEQDLAAARSKSALALGEAFKQISQRFDLQQGKVELERQKQEITALSEGYSELTPDVKAYLDVYEKTIDLSVKDQELLAGQILAYRAQREEYYKNAQALKFLNEQLSLQQDLELARAITPEAEMWQQILNKGYAGEQALQLFDLSKQVEQAKKVKDQIKEIATTISDSFGTAIKDVILGSATLQQALAGIFQSIAESFADMVAKMIAEWLFFQLITGIGNLFGFSTAGPDRATTSLPLINQYSSGLGYANGGIAVGGFQAFADGGMVSGPTLGLVGEGRYNEAIVPLPNGKSIPVELGDSAGNNISSNIVVNVNNGQMQSNGSGNGSQLGRKLEGAVRQVLVEELRPGGVLAGNRR